MRKAVSVVVAALLTTAALASVDSPARAGFTPVVPADAFGVNAQTIFHMGVTDGFPPASDRGLLLAAIRAAGIDVVRYGALWWLAEPNKPDSTDGVNCSSDAWTPVTPTGVHCFRWAVMDQWVSDLASHNLRWMPTIAETPAWEGIVGGCCNIEPRSTDDFAFWVTKFAQRYGVGGAFWSSHPALPYLPVKVYEIWNEQNLEFSWKPFPNPLRYGQLYTAGRNAIHAVDAGAVVITGGLSDGQNVPGDYLKNMFLLNPGMVVDGVGLHPYAVPAAAYISQSLGDLVTFRRTMDQELGLTAVGLYVTEIGWSTAGNGAVVANIPDDAPDGTPNRREALVTTTDQMMRSNCGIRAYQPHTFYVGQPGDTGFSPPPDPNDVETGFGIAEQDGTLKPSGAAWSAEINLLKGNGPVAPPTGIVNLCPWR